MDDDSLYRQLENGCTVLPPMMVDRQSATPAGEDVAAGRDPKGKAKRRKTADRFASLNDFVDCSMSDLSRSEALSWLVLWRDTRDGTARTSATDIARRIGADRRTVTNALSGLRKRGLLSLVYRGGLNRGTNVYRVHSMATPPDRHGTTASRARGKKHDIHKGSQLPISHKEP